MSETVVNCELGYGAVVDGGPYETTFRVCCIVGLEDGNRPLFGEWNVDTRRADEMAAAPAFLHGRIKWDGCSDWYFDEQERAMIHFCNPAEVIALGEMFRWLHRLAEERMKGVVDWTVDPCTP